MAALFNFNTTFTNNSTRNIQYEDEKSEIYIRKPINIGSKNCFIETQEKIPIYFIPTITLEEINHLKNESQKLNKRISDIEISKHLKALKISDLRRVIERISAEDYYVRFDSKRRVFTKGNSSNSSSLQAKV